MTALLVVSNTHKWELPQLGTALYICNAVVLTVGYGDPQRTSRGSPAKTMQKPAIFHSCTDLPKLNQRGQSFNVYWGPRDKNLIQ